MLLVVVGDCIAVMCRRRSDHKVVDRHAPDAVDSLQVWLREDLKASSLNQITLEMLHSSLKRIEADG